MDRLNEEFARVRARDSTLTPAELNNEGYTKMRSGDFLDALPLLTQAVRQLNNTGSFDEAYADFNLANTRYHLGRCTGVLSLLDRSREIQGDAPPIATLRNLARKTCG